MGGNPQPNLVLGIDTGGTYTDCVLLEYETRRVVASHKSLTTKRDFSIGIDEVINGICIEDPSAIKLVSVSTTLATNSIAEGKGKRVALLLIGYDPGLIASFKMESRFATPYYFFFDGGHDLYGREKQALDLAGILAKVSEVRDRVDAIAVSSYFSPLNPEHENRAFSAISRLCDLPIVLGHQLSKKLGSVERATTAALNASLLAALQDFVIAVRRAMERRHIEAPLMVVRGDGTLMSDEFAARSPVETIHSGPAASAIGGRFISNLDDALIVDVGGTTTDIGLIVDGQVTVSEEGATVSDYKTSVKAANLLSIGVGGDSHITWGPEKRLRIGPQRVVPMAYLAWQHPRIGEQLRSLASRTWSQSTPDWLEYWFLLREPQHSMLRTAHHGALIDCLRGGPHPVPEILRRLGLLHVAQVGAEELVRQEVIGKAGLTATDLMHIDGTYAIWDADAAACAWKAFCQLQFRDAEQTRQLVWSQMTEAIVQAIVVFLCKLPLQLGDRQRFLEGRDADIGHWFFYNSLYQTHEYLETTIRLRHPIVGIGAPAAVFLPAVADALHTELVLPLYHHVANAVGAIAGSVVVEEELLVYPRLSADGLEVLGYYVQAHDERHTFEELSDALGFARRLSQERALGAAVRSGADHPQVTIEEVADGLETYRVRAKAVGNPRLEG